MGLALAVSVGSQEADLVAEEVDVQLVQEVVQVVELVHLAELVQEVVFSRPPPSGGYLTATYGPVPPHSLAFPPSGTPAAERPSSQTEGAPPFGWLLAAKGEAELLGVGLQTERLGQHLAQSCNREPPTASSPPCATWLSLHWHGSRGEPNGQSLLEMAWRNDKGS